MQAAASGLTDAEIARLARHFARPARHSPVAGTVPTLIEQGDPTRKIAACASGHGPPAPARTGIPRLAGQDAEHLARQLRLFARNEGPVRGGGRLVALMEHAVGDISEAKIALLADWYAAQPTR